MDMIHPTTKTESGYWLYDEDALMTINVIQMFIMVGREMLDAFVAAKGETQK